MKQIENMMNIKPPRTDLNDGPAQALRARGNPDTSTAESQSSSGVSGDTVTLTNAAAEILKLEEKLADIPDIDHNRVETIQTAIANGEYRVDPEKIMAGLLSFEKGAR